MRKLYPRSLLRLILLGNIIVTMPLLVAVVYVVSNIETLTLRSEELTRDTALAARLGWELPEDIGAMLRIVRQYEVLADPSLLEDYVAAQHEWIGVGKDFATVPMLAELRPGVENLLAAEAEGFTEFRIGVRSSEQYRLFLTSLQEKAQALVDESRRISEQQVVVFRTDVDQLRDRLLLFLLAGLLAVVCFVTFSRMLFARLLRGFEDAVTALGEGQLDKKIRLHGPEDMQEVGRRLDWLRQRLLILEEQRILGLRHVSHELKTPLAALREGASLLTEGAAGSLTPAQQKIVSIMSNNSLRLQTLIDGLLRLQQAGNVGHRTELAPLRLDKLIQRVIDTHQLAARNKQISFNAAMVPLIVSGGHEELTTIVDNLLSNAIKFSPENGAIAVSLQRREELAVLDVTDQGPGVPEGEREQIFQPFYRSSNARKITGVGLGLAIAREFAIAQRGALELIPALSGAHFRLSLPLSRLTT